MRLLCVKSLCDLLLTHPHFNFRTEIISVVLRFITSSDLEVGFLERWRGDWCAGLPVEWFWIQTPTIAEILIDIYAQPASHSHLGHDECTDPTLSFRWDGVGKNWPPAFVCRGWEFETCQHACFGDQEASVPNCVDFKFIINILVLMIKRKMKC